MKGWRLVMVIFPALVIYATMAQGGDPVANDKNKVFSTLQSAVGKVRYRYSERPLPERDVIENIRISVNRLDDGLSNDHVSTAYLSSLEQDASLLYNAASVSDMSESFKTIQTVAEDLTAKLESLSASLGLTTSTWNGELEISVETTKDGQPVKNLLVQMNMVGRPNQQPPFLTLPELTSPSNSSIPPGKYIVTVLSARDHPITDVVATVKGGPNEKIKIPVLIP